MIDHYLSDLSVGTGMDIQRLTGPSYIDHFIAHHQVGEINHWGCWGAKYVEISIVIIENSYIWLQPQNMADLFWTQDQDAGNLAGSNRKFLGIVMGRNKLSNLLLSMLCRWFAQSNPGSFFKFVGISERCSMLFNVLQALSGKEKSLASADVQHLTINPWSCWWMGHHFWSSGTWPFQR